MNRIGQATRLPIGISDEKQLQMRNEAIAAMALIDLDFKYPLKAGVSGCCVDSHFLRYAAASPSGDVFVRKIGDDEQVAFLPEMDAREFSWSSMAVVAIWAYCTNLWKPSRIRCCVCGIRWHRRRN